MARPLLQYPPNVPPAAVIVAARLGGFDVDAKAEKDWPSTAAPVVTFADGAKLSGVVSMLRYFARSSSHSLGLYGNDAFTSTLSVFSSMDNVSVSCPTYTPSFLAPAVPPCHKIDLLALTSPLNNKRAHEQIDEILDQAAAVVSEVPSNSSARSTPQTTFLPALFCGELSDDC